MLDKSLHPAERFEAPLAITAGQPLKDLFDHELVRLISESLDAVVPDFDQDLFVSRACQGLTEGTMSERAAHVAEAMARSLPEDFETASRMLVDSLGPRRTSTDGQGLRGFFYMPHGAYIGRHGVEHLEAGMTANYELTQRFTAEFSIRPFLTHHRDETLDRLMQWTRDANPHVRRLCSEGTRPRLPWASRLPELQADPQLALPLLEALKDDVELYVRRSVANHLGDLCKDHPEQVFELCERWLHEVRTAPSERANQRKWLIRHAVRHPFKKGVAEAIALRKRAKA